MVVMLILKTGKWSSEVSDEESPEKLEENDSEYLANGLPLAPCHTSRYAREI